MDLGNPNGTELRNLQPYRSFSSKIFIRSGKIHHVELNSGTSKLSKQNIFLFV